jgi:hypothetical protein
MLCAAPHPCFGDCCNPGTLSARGCWGDPGGNSYCQECYVDVQTGEFAPQPDQGIQ